MLFKVQSAFEGVNRRLELLTREYICVSEIMILKIILLRYPRHIIRWSRTCSSAKEEIKRTNSVNFQARNIMITEGDYFVAAIVWDIA
jgi:hypothetical protein